MTTLTKNLEEDKWFYFSKDKHNYTKIRLKGIIIVFLRQGQTQQTSCQQTMTQTYHHMFTKWSSSFGLFIVVDDVVLICINNTQIRDFIFLVSIPSLQLLNHNNYRCTGITKLTGKFFHRLHQHNISISKSLK